MASTFWVHAVWIAVGTIGCIWAVSILVTAALALGAHRGNPSVVVDDPWDTEQGRRDLARLREAVARGQLEVADRETDFSRWEHDLEPHAQRVERLAPRRPRPAA
jgi:hypothetical protein